MGSLTYSEDSDEMPHHAAFIRVCTLFGMVNKRALDHP